jgi:Na+-transporting methylmalonyl-CoA/oxaloacetate decarboxylase beta subunit
MSPAPERTPLILIAHRVLIGAAVLFGIFFTILEAAKYRETGEGQYLTVALVAGVITLAMGYYLKNLRRFLGRL